jgi:hypothetical protein
MPSPTCYYTQSSSKGKRGAKEERGENGRIAKLAATPWIALPLYRKGSKKNLRRSRGGAHTRC